MKKIISLLLMLFLLASSGLNFIVMADIHIYRGRYANTSDIAYTFDGKHLYRGRYTNTSDILLTFGAPVPIIINNDVKHIITVYKFLSDSVVWRELILLPRYILCRSGGGGILRWLCRRSRCSCRRRGRGLLRGLLERPWTSR